MNAIFAGLGYYLPDKIITNEELSKNIDTSHEWIYSRTGITQRHVAAQDQTTSDLAAAALRNALLDAGWNQEELDAIIVATCTPDLIMPSTAAIVQAKVGATNAFAFDINAACTGFVYALSLGASLIANSQCGKIAVIGAETMSRIVNWQDRSTCVLFGDGAGAVLLAASEKRKEGVLATVVGADGRLASSLCTNSGASYHNREAPYIAMQGREVFRHGVSKMEESTRKVLDKAGYSLKDLDFLVSHQANSRMIETLATKLGLSQSKVIDKVAHHANTGAASIPLAIATEYVKISGSIIATPAAGAGFTWGCALIKL